MTHASTLDELEQDVARARARLAGDIARLRDPGTISHAKADLMAQAGGYRDRLMATASGAASERAHGLTETLRQRAQENPAAVAAIGAGLLWRLWKHPPVATVLMGAGLASLLAGRGEEGRAPEGLLGGVQAVNRATQALGGRAAELAERARETAADLAEQARVMSDQTAASLTHVAERTAVAIAGLHDEEAGAIRENPVAFTFAAVAIGAALGVALHRRA
jgi:hypothetical protein